MTATANTGWVGRQTALIFEATEPAGPEGPAGS
jgi:hypothetical protein